MPKKKRPEWDFDATTPVESNRRQIETGICPECHHLHNYRGGHRLTWERWQIAYCWVKTPRLGGRPYKFQRCKCEHDEMGPIVSCPCPMCTLKKRRGLGPGQRPAKWHERTVVRKARSGYLMPFDQKRVRWGYWGYEAKRQHGFLGRHGTIVSLCGNHCDSDNIYFGLSENSIPHCVICQIAFDRGSVWKKGY